MEKFPHQENVSDLDNFKKEISKLKKQEEEDLYENGARKKVHFEDLNPDELNEADRVIYQMFLDKKLALKEFRTYQNELGMRGNKSQKKFAAYIANKLFIQMYKKGD